MSNSITRRFCDTIKSVDGRGDYTKQKMMKIVRQAISKEEAEVALKIMLTADWNRLGFPYNGRLFDLTEMDFKFVVDTFWRTWRRNASDFDNTYVQYVFNMMPNIKKGVMDNAWTYMYIFVGDSRMKFRRFYYTPRYPYTIGDVKVFSEDRQVVADWIRKWQSVESDAARITVNIYGEYGNKYRNTSRQFFDYEYATP